MSKKAPGEKGEIFNKLGKRNRSLQQTGKIVTGKVKEVITVAEDQNWRTYVANEVKAQRQWSYDWGFLIQGNVKFN